MCLNHLLLIIFTSASISGFTTALPDKKTDMSGQERRNTYNICYLLRFYAFYSLNNFT
ncbi:hypothetical protein HMPREF0083_02871 [Aneurinibacillus aneurinilyticus ATCC 12856]|uniref:Uncharacterized protein n=1 Tax=Aneurinibacillus aneurinilyticus ATCC 12856 TaxID=649747 RepID=U1X3G7_ANEAE|nr:hypothetical protein HMPREF0083_02871 [Aneurinibacillus aneurinilyticus ATCC 12856]